MTVEPVGTPTVAPPTPQPARSPFGRHPRSEYWDARTARWERCEEAPAAVPTPRRGD
jgi:hypothetical protein